MTSSPPSTPITLPVIQCVAGVREGDHRLRDVGRRGEAAGGVPAEGDRLDPLGPRDLLEGRRVGDPRPDGVDRDPPRRQLHRELAHVGLERRLGRRDRAVVGEDARAAAARHGEDAPAFAHQPPHDHVLGPVHQAVRHDVERHVHLVLRHRLLHRLGDEGLEGAEGQRVEEDPDPARRLAALVEAALDGVEHLGPPVGVGGVHVEEERLAAPAPHLAGDALGVRQGGLPVQVDADDRQAGVGEGEARRLPEARRGAEDERPAGEPDRWIDSGTRAPRGILARRHARVALPRVRAARQLRPRSVQSAGSLHGEDRRHRPHRQRAALRQGGGCQRRVPLSPVPRARCRGAQDLGDPRRGRAHRPRGARVPRGLHLGLHLGRRGTDPRRRDHRGGGPGPRRPGRPRPRAGRALHGSLPRSPERGAPEDGRRSRGRRAPGDGLADRARRQAWPTSSSSPASRRSSGRSSRPSRSASGSARSCSGTSTCASARGRWPST